MVLQLNQPWRIILWYISATTYGLWQQGEFELATNKYADFWDSLCSSRDAADATKMVVGGDDNKLEHHQEPATYDVEVECSLRHAANLSTPNHWCRSSFLFFSRSSLRRIACWYWVDASEERLGYEQQCGNVGMHPGVWTGYRLLGCRPRLLSSMPRTTSSMASSIVPAGEENVTLAEGAATSLVSFRGESQMTASSRWLRLATNVITLRPQCRNNPHSEEGWLSGQRNRICSFVVIGDATENGWDLGQPVVLAFRMLPTQWFILPLLTWRKVSCR